jgi:hypothetical protein
LNASSLLRVCTALTISSICMESPRARGGGHGVHRR